ncbi:MAG: hypothetical protein ACRD1K_02355 [Acidimicrobiales bacterium]
MAGTVAMVAFSTAAPAAPKPPAPPAPTITTGPTGPAASTAASFTYKDSQSGVTFKCALDGAHLDTCPSSGRTYTSLAQGPHTFSVAAQAGNSDLSPRATRAWTVDTAAPALTLSFPSDGGAYNAARWNAGCTPTGLCGTATDPRGVASVQVAVYSGLIPNYVNATLAAPGTTSTAWRLARALPADGSYSVRVRATDGLGNTTSTSAALSASFRIDTTPPPPPLFLEGPTGETTQTDARFRFADLQLDVGFQCSLDQSPFSTCGPVFEVDELTVGNHCLRVRALDPAGNLSGPSERCWTVVSGRTSFTISGSITQSFSPGIAATLNLSLANPNSFAIRVTNVTVTVAAATNRGGTANPGCNGTQNLVVRRQLATDVTVPRNATRSLSQLGLPEAQWPLLEMPNLPVNQDACKATTFTLTYSGAADKA